MSDRAVHRTVRSVPRSLVDGALRIQLPGLMGPADHEKLGSVRSICLEGFEQVSLRLLTSADHNCIALVIASSLVLPIDVRVQPQAKHTSMVLRDPPCSITRPSSVTSTYLQPDISFTFRIFIVVRCIQPVWNSPYQPDARPKNTAIAEPTHIPVVLPSPAPSFPPLRCSK